ncbi:MAG: HXXEE domain-containing protein [Microcystis wesenbergii Mw_QC_S_20081001_S30D]|uniref:HXXEE domain-containing protein n=1 Tax=Microcystis wesenbergii Mw_QC_S_20081001_S30D TaxID=2486245 RepID=A0A552JW42_9CHRO|nr:HXXEE domain-containing protein [Microcystis aeruginosa W11-03]NCR95350.1 HXXEE domain-containing protein [Microcystis aeruginosa W11-06]TRU99949.1 MAG: HXXEE domain-containing protein [Microcystis wesenbergii Mw_QC_S_20081001_S30D]TRV00014.1 MAG: HXXEE domain-containing protein [Microcystis wesenbergii Mw_QC_S_20081001_S30]TRV03037.1 MAG: HXXEE domain-containing protein [Microcystis wesenbergii Mw_QC_B_20070930_S4D]TRV08369.1 MAG: HXXEE domain-containing protein [Microcystis wesenbergii Mw
MLGDEFTKISQNYWFLGLAQVIHSMEETYTELYLKLDSMIEALHRLFSWFPLVEISADVFAILNYLMIALMLGSVPVAAQGKRVGIVLMWSWAVIEMLNGAFHIGTWVFLHTYFPGGISGPILFVLSILFIQQLRVASDQVRSPSSC